MMQKEDFNIFAELLEYPQDAFHKKAADYSKEISDFYDFVKEKSLHELQELYVKTFELDPVCNLYIGVHIFGEDGFKRGSFMARLKEAYLKYGINNNDIADFLPCILRLASKLEDANKFNDLVEECILGPLDLILDSLKKESNPYKSLLIALKEFAKSCEKKEVQIVQNA